MSNIALVPARCGSKSIPFKNISVFECVGDDSENPNDVNMTARVIAPARTVESPRT